MGRTVGVGMIFAVVIVTAAIDARADEDKTSESTPADAAAGILAQIDRALAENRLAAADSLIGDAELLPIHESAIQFRRSRLYFARGVLLGDAEIRAFPEGRAGQFVGRWLLVEPRGDDGAFLCCPRRSALYQVRAALDAGLDAPRAHLLHATIWHELDRPRVALNVLRSREAMLIDEIPEAALPLLADLSLDTGDVDASLRYARRLAAILPARRAEVLCTACRRVARRYGDSGAESLYLHWLQRAARICPDDRGTLLSLADAAWSLDRRAMAADCYRKLLQRTPDHPARSRILARLAEFEVGPGSPGPEAGVP